VDDWFCSPLKIIAITRTEAGRAHAYLIEYLPHGSTEKRRTILSQALLLGRPEDALKLLRDIGVSVLCSHKKLLRDYLDREHLRFSTARPADFYHSVKVVGWYSPTTFVLPNEIIGKQAGVWFSGDEEEESYRRRGTFKQWQSTVAALCVGNPYLIVATSCGFVGPLLQWLNIPGTGFHFYGDSTTGKSTALMVPVSIWGAPRFLLSWRSTINGQEAQASKHSATFLALDESHQVDPKVLDAGVYMLANGVAKARMTREIISGEVRQWRVSLLSSGERSIESHLNTAQITHKAGQSVRIVDLPVRGKFGLFDALHEAANGREFADQLRDNAAKCYGHAGPAFISRLIAELPCLDLPGRLSKTVSAFSHDLNPQESRVAQVCALSALAGELAVEWNIVPWKKDDATRAAVKLFSHWRHVQPQSASSIEHAQILRQVSDFINRYGDSRFSNINWAAITDKYGKVINEEPLIRERCGYWEESDDEEGGRVYLFNSGGLHEASSGFDFERVLDALDEAGAFTEKGTGGQRARKRRDPTKQPIKLYHIDPAKLELPSSL
jgi:putative DNA primase/helicase